MVWWEVEAGPERSEPEEEEEEEMISVDRSLTPPTNSATPNSRFETIMLPFFSRKWIEIGDILRNKILRKKTTGAGKFMPRA